MNNFTPRAQQVLALARKEADRFNHNYVGTEHLLLGLIKLGQGVAVNVLQKMGLDLETVRMEVEKQVGSGPDTKMSGNIPYTPRVKKVLALAGKEAKALHHSYVGTEHILLGLLREGDGVAARVLKSLDIDLERTRNEVLKELDPNFEGAEEDEFAGEMEEPTTGSGGGKKEVKTPALKAFGRDLTDLAKKGDLDPVIGRKEEIERVIQILCRRTKN
ncbi:MAG: Clp protease N-terminal domain-containing protein, partial [Verrucomicrobiota bacterium]